MGTSNPSINVRVFYRYPEDHDWKCLLVSQNSTYSQFVEKMSAKLGESKDTMTFRYGFASDIDHTARLTKISNDEEIDCMLYGGNVYMIVSLSNATANIDITTSAPQDHRTCTDDKPTVNNLVPVPDSIRGENILVESNIFSKSENHALEQQKALEQAINVTLPRLRQINREKALEQAINGTLPRLRQINREEPYDISFRTAWRKSQQWYSLMSPTLKNKVNEMGFGTFLQVDPWNAFRLPIDALLEFWNLDFHTFQFGEIELVMNLEDVSQIMGLQCHGLPVTLSSKVQVHDLANKLLGVTEPAAFNGKALSLLWLRALFAPQELVDDDKKHKGKKTVKVTPARRKQAQENEDIVLRAFLMHLFGTTLFQSSNGDAVNGTYLQLLSDLDGVRNYAWGAATLAHIYGQLDGISRGQKTWCGPLFLLEVWMWEHIPFTRPASSNPTHQFPRLMMWHKEYKHLLGRMRAKKPKEGERSWWYFIYRFFHLQEQDIIWRPYRDVTDRDPDVLYRAHTSAGSDLWLPGLGVYELQPGTRGLRHIGKGQPLPRSPIGPVSMSAVSCIEQLSNWINGGDTVESYTGGDCAPGYLEYYKKQTHFEELPLEFEMRLQQIEESLKVEKEGDVEKAIPPAQIGPSIEKRLEELQAQHNELQAQYDELLAKNNEIKTSYEMLEAAHRRTLDELEMLNREKKRQKR